MSPDTELKRTLADALELYKLETFAATSTEGLEAAREHYRATERAARQRHRERLATRAAGPQLAAKRKADYAPVAAANAAVSAAKKEFNAAVKAWRFGDPVTFAARNEAHARCEAARAAAALALANYMASKGATEWVRAASEKKA